MSEKKCLECSKRKKLEHSGFWCCGGNHCEKEVRAKVINEIYTMALNETHDTLIEWLQANIIDEEE